MAQLTSINSHVKDFSFANIFWRKFAIRLLALLIISVIILCLGRPMIKNYCDNIVKSELNDISLSLAQLVDSDMPENKMRHEANLILANAHREIDTNPFIVDSSVSFYDITTKELIAKSFEVPVAISDEVIDWWKEQTNSKIGNPMIALTEEMISFYYEHENDCIYIEKIFCINNVLRPTKMIAKDENGKDLGSCESTVPSIETLKYTDPVELKIIGNKIGDKVYGLMVNFTINSCDEEKELSEEIYNAEEPLLITYDIMPDDDSVQVTNKSFVINQTTYQVDYGYQSDFWSGAWQYVLICELFGILSCALLAFINTKETLAIYQ